MFGFEREHDNLKNHLLSSDINRSVISIVGESGIGKSTLAWNVYDSSSIRKEFEVRAWINVPPQINDTDILYFIYKRLCPENADDVEHLTTTRGVHDALIGYLSDKRYLVMVDGLASFSNWNSILPSFPNNGKGSRVMIITRLEDKEAAYLADPKVSVEPFNIDKLNKEKSIELFCHKVGHNTEKDNYCETIYDITKGLPLAIVLLAGLLRTKPIEKRKEVLEKLKSGDEPKKVKRILALCFDDLPSRLKSCFLYFAGMPENLIFNARRIVRLWAAEGFLKPKKGENHGGHRAELPQGADLKGNDPTGEEGPKWRRMACGYL